MVMDFLLSAFNIITAVVTLASAISAATPSKRKMMLLLLNIFYQ